MSLTQKLPEHVIEDVISKAIDLTQYRGWQMSLRLVNRSFNEAVLRVFYLQKRLAATCEGHTLDCTVATCDFNRERKFCRSHEDSRTKRTYAGRFNIQSFLTIRKPLQRADLACQLQQKWTVAATILRETNSLKQLSRDQIRFYSTCSDSPVFNDISVAVLCEAVVSFQPPYHLQLLAKDKLDFLRNDKDMYRCPAFWVALSACVLGDLQLFDTYFSKLTQSVKTSISMYPPELEALLNVAIKQGKPHITRRLLEQYPNAISKTDFGNQCLSAAIFGSDHEVLKVVLQHTPQSSDLLYKALYNNQWAFIPPISGPKTVRILTRHFAPLCAESRSWLILQSCALGDISVLEEFSKTEPLFSHRVEDAGGRLPTYFHVAIRHSNVKVLRFLINHGVFRRSRPTEIISAIEYASSYNQIECCRELFNQVEEARLVAWAHFYGLADNAEGILAHLIHETENKECMFEASTLNSPRKGRTLAQEALRNAIIRLRPGNVQYLLSEGVRLSSWLNDGFLEIKWPYYNLNQNNFLRTQAVLEASGLPGLKVVF